MTIVWDSGINLDSTGWKSGLNLVSIARKPGFDFTPGNLGLTQNLQISRLDSIELEILDSTQTQQIMDLTR